MKQSIGLTLISALFLVSCSTQKTIGKSAKKFLLEDETLRHAHVGISVYNSSKDKKMYQYQADKFFAPASNTKIVTTYAALKYLNDSLAGVRYYENDTAVYLVPTGDPTFLHEDYSNHPVLNFLKSVNKKIYIADGNWKSNAFGQGWSWGDYNAGYSPERSPMPMYGNYLKFVKKITKEGQLEFSATPAYFSSFAWKTDGGQNFYVQRDWRENHFTVNKGADSSKRQDVPYVTNGIESAVALLKDLLKKEVRLIALDKIPSKEYKTIYSQPLDSMLRPLMHRSDNFFAEQTLIMVANELTGELSDSKGINELRKTIYKDVPNNFRWADGSGLSRSNHFAPNDFIFILQELRNTVGMERIKNIFPHGGVGTLSGLYKEIPDKMFAKTGTLNGVVALSGFLETKKGNNIVFSLLVNNHRGDANHVRRQFQHFIMHLYNKY